MEYTAVLTIWDTLLVTLVTEIKYLGIHIVNSKSFKITTEQSIGVIFIVLQTLFLAE